MRARNLPVAAKRCRSRGTNRSASLAFRILGVITLSLAAMGCRAVEAAGDVTRDVVVKGDPTGFAADTRARKEAADAIRDQVRAVDVDTLNKAVHTLSYAADALAERIRLITPEMVDEAQADLQAAIKSLRMQIEAAELQRTTRAIADTGEAAKETLAALDVEAFNNLITRLDETLAGITRTAEQLDAESQETLRSVRTLIDRLPVEEVRVSAERIRDTSADARLVAQKLPQTTANVDSALQSLRTGVRVFAVASALLGACALLWLVNFFRGRNE